MKKVKPNKKLIPLLLAVVATFSIFLYAKSTSAEHAINEEASVKLNVEKLDKDTIKIALDNFEPNIKALQFGLKIDGNAVFKEEGIKSLVTSNDENMKTNIKISDDKKGMEVFIVSTEPLNRKSTIFEICEVDLEKANDKKTGFSITPYSIDSTGTSITYILSDTNKRVCEIISTEAQTININSAPIIELNKSKFIINGEIILPKGKDFVAEDYVNVTDEDSNFTLTYDDYKVKKNNIGVYNVTYTATDDYGDVTTLLVPVVVEEADSLPVINIENSMVVDSTITVTKGEEINLLEGITAHDFRGRELEVKIDGKYDVNKADTYPVKLIAEDIHGNINELPLNIVVGKITTLPDDVPVEDIKPDENIDNEMGIEQDIIVENEGNAINNTHTLKINTKQGLDKVIEWLDSNMSYDREKEAVVDKDTNTTTYKINVFYHDKTVSYIKVKVSSDNKELIDLLEKIQTVLPPVIEEIPGEDFDSDMEVNPDTDQVVDDTPVTLPDDVPVEDEEILDGTENDDMMVEPESTLPDDIINIGGNGTEESPMSYKTESLESLNKLIEQAKDRFKVVVINREILSNETQKYFIRLDKKEIVAKLGRLLGIENSYYIALIVPNNDEFNSVLSKLDKDYKDPSINEEKPGDVDTPNNPNTSTDKDEAIEKEENGLPATGQGVYFVTIIVAAIIIIGLGIFMMPRKKHKH